MYLDVIICDLNLHTQIVSWLYVCIVLPDLSDSKKVGYLVSTVVLGYGLDSSNIQGRADKFCLHLSRK